MASESIADDKNSNFDFKIRNDVKPGFNLSLPAEKSAINSNAD